MKSKWRAFCEEFKHVEDFSFATLIRLNSSQDYEEVNSVIVTKIQFYAIELARNREGHNDQIRHNFKPRKRAPKKAPGSIDVKFRVFYQIWHFKKSLKGCKDF